MNNIRLGEKVASDAATINQGKVRMGDCAPVFRAGDKVIRDATTANQDKVRVGDMAPAFTAKK